MDARSRAGEEVEAQSHAGGRLRLLVLAATYPYPARNWTGHFNERCVEVLRGLCERVEVLVPRPYLPAFLPNLKPRWAVYRQMPAKEIRSGVRIERPAYVEVPALTGSWSERTKFLACLGAARRMHQRERFDAILAFDLMGVGGLAWRIGRALGIPAAGWALGSDVRASVGSQRGRDVAKTLRRLELVFYQSEELRDAAAGLLETRSRELPVERHIVLPHGIPPPPPLDREHWRSKTREEWGVATGQLVVLYTGRLIEAKGVFDLLTAFALAAGTNQRLTCVLLGSSPEFDESETLRATIRARPELAERLKVFPAIHPDRVWEQLCGADIFAFPSHNEGMPNSLLEAMAMGVPAVAFGIPAAREIDAGRGVLRLVPPFDVRQLADALRELAASEPERRRLGNAGFVEVTKRFSIQKNIAVAASHLARLTTRIATRSGCVTGLGSLFPRGTNR